MAYRTYRLLDHGDDLDVNVMFNHVLQGITNIGWTLHNTISASDVVYKSNGEDGMKATCYLRVILNFSQNTAWNRSASVKMLTYLYFPATGTAGAIAASYIYNWDLTHHYGTTLIVNTSNFNLPFYFGGDKDMIFMSSRAVMTGYNSTVFGCAGHLRKIFGPDRRALTTGILEQGADKTVTVSETAPWYGTAGFRAGDKLQLVGATEGRWYVTVSEIISSTQMRIAAVPATVQAGAYLGDMPARYGRSTRLQSVVLFAFQLSNPPGVTGFDGVGGYSNLPDGNYWSHTQVRLFSNSLDRTLLDPAGANGRFCLAPLMFYEADTVGNPSPGYRFYDDVGLMCANGADENSVFVRNTDENTVPYYGLVSGFGADWLEDSGKSYIADELAGRIAICTYDSGLVFSAKILSNTATRINLCIPFDKNLPPESGRQYAVADECWRRIAGGNFYFKEVRDSNITL